jgi:diguanylate cyclase (GGDEF)-like protein
MIRRLLTCALLAMAQIAGVAPAAAQTGLGGTPLSVCVTPARPGETPSALFNAPKRFDCTVRQTTLGPGDFWVLSAPLSQKAAANRTAKVRINALWQKGVTLYGHYADGVILADHATDATIGRRIQLGGIIQHTMPGRPARLDRLLWRVDGAANLRGILVGAQLATPEESIRANLILAAIYAGFGGLCIALLIYNLAMWWALRHPFQLAYCGMIIALLGYAFSSSGALAWFWPDITSTLRMRLNYVMLGTAGTMAIVFARTFFESELFTKWLNRLIWAVCALLATASAAFGAFAPWNVGLLNQVYTAAFLTMLAVLPVMLWRALRARSNYLWMFCVAWGLPVAFAALRVASNLNYFRWSFWIENSTILAMTSEALLSALAIVYRIRLLSDERDDARIKELAARALADTDPLTGLLNRRAFLRQAIGRTGEQMLLVVDIDHFKAVNETIGHDGGDEVLRVFARALRGVVPADALVARIGGEEFAIVAHHGHHIVGEDVLARLRAERMPFDLTVTASIGCCSGPLLSEADWKHLYRRADRALYDAKAQGRDRARSSQSIAVAA